MTEPIKVGRVDPKMATSAINGQVDEPSSSQAAAVTAAGCLYNGIRYSTSSRICADGTFLYCEADGTWSPGGSC